MGLLELQRVMSTQRERELRRRHIQPRNGLVATLDKRKAPACGKGCVATGSIASGCKRKGSPCQQDDSIQSCEEKAYPGPELPEDIWRHIHSLMPLRDAARASCVSHAFLCSWRSYPNLTFSAKTLGLKGKVVVKGETARDFANKVDHILKKHSGIGVKTFKLLNAPNYDAKDSYCIDSWLQKAVKPGIEELAVCLSSKNDDYKFPCSLLSDGNADSIRYLNFACCTFRPSVGFGCLGGLTSLHLNLVRITGDELGCLLSNSLALERLTIKHCSEILCLKIPCHLWRLSYLEVLSCRGLKVIDNEAPNLSKFQFLASSQVQVLVGARSHVKNLFMGCPGIFSYTCTELASRMPNLESLTIRPTEELVNTPMVSSRFLHLKYLRIRLGVNSSPNIDYFCLVSLMDASPSLETLVLDVSEGRIEHMSVHEDPSDLRDMPGQIHGKLKNVMFRGFSSAKSLIELTRHILGLATSLERCILDTKPAPSMPVCSADKVGKCYSMKKDRIVEALKALLAIEIYIKPKVPSTVRLNVGAPCSRCHVVEELAGPTPRLSMH